MKLPPAERIIISSTLVTLLAFVALVTFLPHAAYGAGGAYTLDVSSPTALHQSTLDCASVGGSWSNQTYTCTVSGSGAVPGSSTLSVDRGANLVITKGATFTLSGYLFSNSGSVTNAGTIQINDAGGQYSSSPGSSFINTGTITNGNGGSGSSGYAFIFASGGTFSNQGTINNQKDGAIQDLNSQSSPGTLSNSGTINNNGFLQLYSGQRIKLAGPSGFSGTFTNTGKLNMLSGGTLTVGYGGSLYATTLEITSGTFTVPSGVTLYVSQSGTLQVDSGAILVVSGFVTNQAGPDSSGDRGGDIDNYGDIVNMPTGTITNSANATAPIVVNSKQSALINNYGNITNDGQGSVINNMLGGNFSNTGDLTNYGGVFTNSGNASNSGFIEDYSTPAVFNNYGTFSNTAEGRFDSAGTLSFNQVSINNYGVIRNDGTLNNNHGSTMTNKGGAAIFNSGMLNNEAGNIINNGLLNNTGTVSDDSSSGTAGGTFYNPTITNNGVLNNNAGGTIHSGEGTINNVGTINNNAGGTITQYGGNITNSGTFTNYAKGTIQNYYTGIIVNNAGGTINNAFGTIYEQSGGSITNNPKATIINSGSITNYPSTLGGPGISNLSNYGTITNTGIITSDANSYTQCMITNGGTITNMGGTITNQGVLSNTGTIVNNPGTITNQGLIVNSGTIANNVGTITNTGTIANRNGIITNSCAGVFVNTGTLTGAPVQDTCQSSQSGSAPVSSGSVSTQTFSTTGITVSVSGSTGTTASISTQEYAAQPPNSGTSPLGPASGLAMKFYDVGISGVTGGTAHVCVSSTYVGSNTLIDYYSSNSWSQAASISDTAATNTTAGLVCGNIPVSGLTGSPLVIGDPKSATSSTTTGVFTTATATSKVTTTTAVGTSSTSRSTTSTGASTGVSTASSGSTTSSSISTKTSAATTSSYLLYAAVGLVAVIIAIGVILFLKKR